jgi:putative membrane protein
MSGLAALPLADYWGMHDGDVGLGWGLVMILGMLVFWGLVIAGVVWLARSASSSRDDREDSPRDILDRGLAQGTISPEEYERRRALLTRPSRPEDGESAGRSGGAIP